LGTTKYFFFI